MKLLVSAIAFAGTLSVTAAQNFTDYAYVYVSRSSTSPAWVPREWRSEEKPVANHHG